MRTTRLQLATMSDAKYSAITCASPESDFAPETISPSCQVVIASGRARRLCCRVGELQQGNDGDTVEWHGQFRPVVTQVGQGRGGRREAVATPTQGERVRRAFAAGTDRPAYPSLVIWRLVDRTPGVDAWLGDARAG
jgi:hypothetical protein